MMKSRFGFARRAQEYYRELRTEIMDGPLRNYTERARSIDIGAITSGANVEVLRRLRDNDSDLTELAVCREHDRGEWGGNFACYCPSSIEDLGWAGVFIGNNTKLLDLYLSGGILATSNSSLLKLLAGVSRNTTICWLRLDAIDLSNGDVLQTMGPFFANNNNLRRVALCDCEFGDEGDRLLSRLLRSCHSPLKILALENNLGEGEQPLSTIGALSRHSQLNDLSLIDMIIGRDECRALAELPCFTNLVFLDLSANNVDDEGVEVLTGAAANGSELFYFDLSHNPSITTQGLRSLADFLESSQCNLRRLFLLWNGVDDEGANILAQSLAHKNCKLKYLGLVEDDAGNTIAAGLDIVESDNLITAQGWSAFDDALCNTSTVQATGISNHTFESFSSLGRTGCDDGDGGGGGGAIPSSLAFSLRMNRIWGAREAARRKIIRHHLSSDEGMRHFTDIDPAALPLVMACAHPDELSLLYCVVRNFSSELGFASYESAQEAEPQCKRQKTSGR